MTQGDIQALINIVRRAAGLDNSYPDATLAHDAGVELDRQKIARQPSLVADAIDEVKRFTGQ